jgi:hypothetical protein
MQRRGKSNHQRAAAAGIPRAEAAGPAPGATVWWKWAISFGVVFHLWALLGRPLQFATQGPTGPSPAASAFYAPVRPYSEFTYLNHGYAFFAPNPGPSHLVRATIERDGDATEELWYPDLRRQWPRLLYHRHFMLTEFLHNTFQPAEIPPELSEEPEVLRRWQRDRRRYEAIRGSFASHLRERYDASRVELVRVEHQLVGLPEFLAGARRLDDPELYLDLPDDPPPAEVETPRFGVPNRRGDAPFPAESIRPPLSSEADR